MLARAVHVWCLALVLAQEPQPQTPSLTPCQRCCQAGGDCSKAFKGTPGKCCGTAGDKAFCCPGSFGAGAKCANCGNSYRCFTGMDSRGVCGPTNNNYNFVSRQRYSHRGASDDGTGGVFGLLLIIVVVGLVWRYACAPQHQYDPMGGWGKPAAGVPLGQPAYGQPAYGAPVCGGPAYPMPPPTYGYPGYQNNGYSGLAVAGSAATGFMGGMLVSEMMHDHGGHHHHGGDYGGGDYGGGGGYSSGGDMGGGGDGGFAADN